MYIVIEIYNKDKLLSSAPTTQHISREEAYADLVKIYTASKKKRQTFFNLKITDSYFSRDWKESSDSNTTFTTKFVIKDIIAKKSIPQEYLCMWKQPGV